MDARREDGSIVAIKWIPDEFHTHDEIDILRYLASDALRDDPRNYACPLLDTFSHPTISAGIFTVSPWLGTLIYYPIRYVHDLADMMLQCFEVPAPQHGCSNC